jgi:dephospho-CoA kinase
MSETSEREARAAQNELVFRAVNEQIVKMTDRFREQLADIDIVCECANTNCVGTIRIHADEFTRIERAGGRFLVLPGHEDESVERVVERSESYVTVWKPSISVDGGVPSMG